jgi:hypothetical protein
MAGKSRKTPSRSSASRKAAKSKPSRRPSAARRKPRKPVAKVSVRRPRKSEPSLGRPLVRVEEKLYLLFKEDYEARQIFEFLRVETVGDLEKFSAQQIIQILSAPVRRTVERIRERLAENKRSLRDDASFAREYLSSHDGR